MHQGDPLGSILFALAIHDTLLEVATLDDVHIFDYADNITLFGDVDAVTSAATQLAARFAEDGLALNDRESEFYFPAGHGLDEAISIGDHGRIPVAREGLKVLGGAVGTDAFCTGVFQKQVERILTDLARLDDIPHRHLRSKLAIYCCNGRLSYFMRLANLQTSLPEAQRFDQAMAAFFRQTLRFPPPGQYGMRYALYELAIQQLRFPINDGGWGLSSAHLSAPCALYGGIGSFVHWYRRFRGLTRDRGTCSRFFRPPAGPEALLHCSICARYGRDVISPDPST